MFSLVNSETQNAFIIRMSYKFQTELVQQSQAIRKKNIEKVNNFSKTRHLIKVIRFFDINLPFNFRVNFNHFLNNSQRKREK